MPVEQWKFCCVKWNNYIASRSKFKNTLLLLNSPDVKAIYQDFFNVIRKQVCVLLTMLELLLIPSYVTLFLLASIINFQNKKKSACSRDFQTNKYCEKSEELSSNTAVPKLCATAPWGAVRLCQGRRKSMRKLLYLLLFSQ